jgi:hypothetical protein
VRATHRSGLLKFSNLALEVTAFLHSSRAIPFVGMLALARVRAPC